MPCENAWLSSGSAIQRSVTACARARKAEDGNLAIGLLGVALVRLRNACHAVVGVLPLLTGEGLAFDLERAIADLHPDLVRVGGDVVEPAWMRGRTAFGSDDQPGVVPVGESSQHC